MKPSEQAIIRAANGIAASLEAEIKSLRTALNRAEAEKAARHY
jgi:hypothetical protein